ncbi:MAG: metallophosphoesterase [Nitriliruptorales bacterium]|nr:metallophosphoesterase [Nitriliruptorales bacterium]
MHPAVKAALGVAASGAACVTYGVVVERHWFRLRELEVPDSDSGLRVLHVADLHLTPPERPMERFLDGVAERAYDLVVATGDLLGAVGAEDVCVELLGRLTRWAPGVAVLGSNDVYAPAWKNPAHYFLRPDDRVYGARLDTERLVGGLEDVGYSVLRGETAVIGTRSGPVGVGGIDDPHLQGPLPPVGDLQLTRDDVVARIGLTHSPYTDALDLLVDAGYDLLLAGHTHGGQVRFPPIGAVVNNCDLPLDRSRGLSRWRGAWLHVSPGLGTSPYAPFRFACRPEATLLTL